jgi:hypothetical protein
MKEVGLLLFIFLVWFVLQKFILPRMGIQT